MCLCICMMCDLCVMGLLYMHGHVVERDFVSLLQTETKSLWCCDVVGACVRLHTQGGMAVIWYTVDVA